MGRYIDADKIKQELLAEDAEIGKPKDLKTAFKSAGIFHALIHIQLAEAEDVAPVVHAHWEMYRDETNCTYGNYACTNCHTIQGLMKYRYCPYCGAKMDEEVPRCSSSR